MWGSVGVTGAVTGTVAGVRGEGHCGSVVTCGVSRGCTGDHRGRGKGSVRDVGRRGWGYGTLEGVGVREVLPRCSMGAAKPAFCRRAPSTPNIIFQNTVSHCRGVWVVARKCGSKFLGRTEWQEPQL